MGLQKKLIGISGAAAFMAAAVFSAMAAGQGGQPATPADEGAPAADASASEAQEPKVEVKPRPSEIMPMTVRGLLLDVASTGQGFVAVGDRGGILTSPDGKQWTQVPVPARAALTAVYFADPSHGWAVGHDATIVATTDGGKSWMLQYFHPELEKPLLDVLFLDANRGFAVGAYGLFLKTEDAGKTWAEVDAPPVRQDELHLNSIVKLRDGSLFIAGEGGTLDVSSDEGKTWTKLKSPYDSSLFGALPFGDKGALIFGLRGNAYLTQDVKSNKWTKLETHSVASMFGGTVLPDGEMAMVGLNGVILVTDASGKVRALQSPTGTPLSAAVPLDDSLLAVGESGVQTITAVK